MRFKEYGADQRDTVILLHGGGLSWWNFREAAQLLQTDYHVILPILDGHAGSDKPFTTIEDNAAGILSMMDALLDSPPLLIGGLSLGGQILLEMLAQRKDACRFALVESAMVLPQPLTHALIGLAFGSCYGLMRNKSFAKTQFKSLHMKPELFDDYYRDTAAITRADLIAFLKESTAYSVKESIRACQADVHLFVGAKETRGIRRSAEKLRRMIPGSALWVLPGLYHGEFSMNHANEYTSAVRAILRGDAAPVHLLS